MGLELLRQVVEQMLKIKMFRTIPRDFDRDGIRRLGGDLEQLDQPLQRIQLNQTVAVLIQKRKSLPCLKSNIAKLQGQQQAPIPQTHRTFSQPMGVENALEVLKREFSTTHTRTVNHLSRRDLIGLQTIEQTVKFFRCEAFHSMQSQLNLKVTRPDPIGF